MAKSVLKIKARALRKRGKSIREIESILKIPLSTISLWCRDIELSAKQKQRLINKERNPSYKSRLLATERAKKQRLEKIKYFKNKGIEEIGSLKNKEIFIAGLGLYWGEGYRSQEKIGFTSKDEKIIRFMMFWFEKILNIKKQDFILRISVNTVYKKREKAMKDCWSKITGIHSQQFTKTSFIKSKQNKIYENSENYYGTLRITIRKSTDKHRLLMGWLDGLYKNIAF